MFWAYLAAGVFAWACGMLGVFAYRASREQIPFRSKLGLRGPAVRRDVTVWDNAHRAAAPFLGTAAFICLIQAAACAWAAWTMPSGAALYLALLVATGIVLVALLLVLAQKAGSRFF